MRFYLIFLTILVVSFGFSPALAQSANGGDQRHYSYSDGETSFVLSKPYIRNGVYDATIQMDEGGEIWILNKSQGFGGSIVYKNDMGRVFLRVNLRGGATIYPTPDSHGIPVLKESEFKYEAMIDLVPEEEASLTSIEDWSRMYDYAGNKNTDSGEASSARTDDTNIKFADWPRSKSAYKSALIAHLTEFMDNDVTPDVERIVVKIGEEPGARHQDKELIIWVNPSLGYAGRPSTEKIRHDLNIQKD